jgi:hypothetical protein
MVMQGHEFPFHPNHAVLTVFSAPDYCEECRNKGAMLKVDKDLNCSFATVEAPGKPMTVSRRPVTPW